MTRRSCRCRSSIIVDSPEGFPRCACVHCCSSCCRSSGPASASLNTTSSCAAARSTTGPAARASRATSRSCGDRIAYVGPKAPGRARREIDAAGQAVAPGFINMLSWSNESLLVDGRGQGELRQGVTLQVMGEGESMGPLTPQMKQDLRRPAGRPQVPGRVDHARRVPRPAREEGRLDERRFARRRGDGAHQRARVGGRGPDARAARGDAGARAPGDGGRRARRRLVADLRARHVRRDRRAGRARVGRARGAAASMRLTCAARDAAWSRRWTRRSTSRGARARPPRSTT